MNAHNARQAEDIVTPIAHVEDTDNLAMNAEATLLCALMFSVPGDPDPAIAAAHLRADDFSDPRRGELFTVIAQLIKAGEGHDPVRVQSHLANNGNAQPRVTELLATIALLETPPVGIQARALDVLNAAYRRSFRAAAQRQAQAADEEPTDALFDIILEAGTAMRTYTRRIAELTNA